MAVDLNRKGSLIPEIKTQNLRKFLKKKSGDDKIFFR